MRVSDRARRSGERQALGPVEQVEFGLHFHLIGPGEVAILAKVFLGDDAGGGEGGG